MSRSFTSSHWASPLAALVVSLRIIQVFSTLVLQTDKPAKEVFPDQARSAAVLANNDVTFYCSVSTAVTDVADITTISQSSISDVRFKINGVLQDKAQRIYVNESTIEMVLTKVQLSQNDSIIACVRNDEEDRMLLLVGDEPNLDMTLNCEAYDWKVMNCSWIVRNSHLYTRYELKYDVSGNPCQVYTINSCSWKDRELRRTYVVALYERTALGSKLHPFMIPTASNLKLAKVKDLQINNITARACNITWDHKTYYVKYGYLYEVNVAAVSTPYARNFRKSTKDKKYLVMRNLSPDTEYLVTVRVRHTDKGQVIGYFSDNKTTHIRTKEDVPDANPEMHPLGYITQRLGEDTTITVYWKDIPLSKRNGNVQYKVTLTAEDKELDTAYAATTTAKFTTKVVFNVYIVYVQAMTSVGINTLLDSSKTEIHVEEVTQNVRFLAIKNITSTKLIWEQPDNKKSENSDWLYTVFTCQGTIYNCTANFTFIAVDNVTSLEIPNKEGGRYGLGVKSIDTQHNRTRRDVSVAAHSTSFSSGIQWCSCYPDMAKIKDAEPMILTLAPVQRGESLAIEMEKVPCYAKAISVHLKSGTNSTVYSLPASDVYHVINNLTAGELYEIDAKWVWEYGSMASLAPLKYTVTRSGLTSAQLGAIITVMVIALSLVICGIYGIYRKCHKTIKKEVDITVPERQQFDRLTDMDLIDNEEYTALGGTTLQPTEPLTEPSETPNRRITLDNPMSDEERRHNVYHTGLTGPPACRQRSQSLESGRPKWMPALNGRLRSNSVVETQQQMDVVSASMGRGRLQRGAAGSGGSFTEDDNGSIYFRMDSTSNAGSQGSLNSAGVPPMRPRATSVSSVGSAASSFLWMSNSNEDLVDLSVADNSCHYKITSSGPYAGGDGYLKPRSSSPGMHRRQLYKNFSVIREEEEDEDACEYMRSSREEDGDASSPLDPLDAEVAEVNYMAMSNNNDRSFISNGISNLTYDFPKSSYKSLTRGRLLSASSMGSTAILEDEYDDENDLYRICSNPVGRQERSASFDVGSIPNAFARPRSASVDLLNSGAFHPALLWQQRLSGNNEYMNPDNGNESFDSNPKDNYFNMGAATETSESNSNRNYLNQNAEEEIYENSSDRLYLNMGASDVVANNTHYKSPVSSIPHMKTPKHSENLTKVDEDYMVPISEENHTYSVVADDISVPEGGNKKKHLERQYSVIDCEDDEVMGNGAAHSEVMGNGGVYNGDHIEHEYELAR